MTIIGAKDLSRQQAVLTSVLCVARNLHYGIFLDVAWVPRGGLRVTDRMILELLTFSNGTREMRLLRRAICRKACPQEGSPYPQLKRGGAGSK